MEEVRGCLIEFVIGMAILVVMGIVLSSYGFPEGNDLAHDVDAALPGLIVLGALVFISAGFLTRSTERAESVGIPGAGCGYYLVMFALAVVVIGFFVVGTLATIGD